MFTTNSGKDGYNIDNVTKDMTLALRNMVNFFNIILALEKLSSMEMGIASFIVKSYLKLEKVN